jgi:RHS repeat-associated protein
MKSATRILSVFIAILMVLYIVPMSVFAEIREITTPKGSDETTSESRSETIRALTVLGEVTDKRTSTTKTFRMSDESYVAVQYGTQIHYETNEGYVEYDNSLKYVDSKNNNDISGYKAVSTDFDLTFAANLNDDSLVTVRDIENNYLISIDPISDAKGGIGEIENPEECKKVSGTIDEYAKVQKLSSSVVYPDVFGTADLKYTLSGGNLKENIVVEEKSEDYIYDFTIILANLVPEIDGNGNIVLKDEKTSEIKYIIPKGFMYDSKDEYSDAINYELEKKEENEYILSVKADNEWLNSEERAFPVSIDPTIEAYSASIQKIKDTYIIQNEPNSNRGNYAWMSVGYGSDLSAELISLIGIKQDNTSDLPSIPKTSVITSATLSLRSKVSKFSGTGDIYVGAYNANQINTTWEAGTATWNNTIGNGSLTIDSTLLDYQIVSLERNENNSNEIIEQFHEFDITDVVKDWYKNADGKYCVALRAIYPSADTYIGFDTVNYTDTVYPYFTIAYRDIKGIEDKWSYTGHDIGNGGTASICDFSGSLVYLHNDVNTVGGLLPISVNHVYNSYLANVPFTANSSNNFAPITANFNNMKLGYGFKLSLQETIKKTSIVDVFNTGNVYYVLSDGDGTEHYYEYDSQEPSGNNIKKIYVDEDNPTLTLTVIESTSGDLISGALEDWAGNKKEFDASGRLISINDANGNYKTVTYNSNGQITYLNEKRGQTETTLYKFVYVNNILHKICQAVGSNNYTDCVQYYYSTTYNGSLVTGSSLSNISSNSDLYLRKISEAKGVDISINYDSDGYITKITDLGRSSTATSYSAEYTYTSENSFKRVESVMEKGGATTGQKYKISYDTKKTVFHSPGADGIYNTSSITSTDDVKTVCLFDNSGYTVTAYSTNYNGEKIYAVSNAKSDEKGKLLNSISGGVQAQNYILNGSFESSGNWTGNIGTGCTGSRYSNASNSLYGKYYYGLKSTVNNGTASIYQNVTISEPDTYTASVYVYNAGMTGEGAYIRAKKGNTILGTSRKTITDRWERISVTFNAQTSGSYTIEIGISSSKGTARFDAVQLEKENVPNDFNTVNSPGFDTSSAWTKTNSTISTNTDAISNSSALVIAGSPVSEAYAYQTIQLNSPTTQTYMLSGWAKANSVALEEERTFNLSAEIWYDENGTDTETTDLYFNPEVSEWQYVSGAIIPNTEKATVYKIKLYCRYDHNGNTAYFDNISLVRENATVYERENSNGYVTKVTSQGQSTEVDYDENDVSSISYSDGYSESFQYNGGHQVTKDTVIKKDQNGNTISVVNTYYTYDSFGNVISCLKQTSNDELQSNVGYSSDGKFKTWERDENHIRTNYAYDTLTGSVTSITMHPDESNSSKDIVTRTEYSSTTDLPVKTYIDSDKDGVADSSERQINYTYDDNLLLTAISTGSTQYNIEYNAFRNISAVRIYGRSAALASYAYEANNGNLSSVTYANGFTIQNVYDNLDRITAIKYNNVVKYRYTYDGIGRLYSAEDVSENRTSYYEYNINGGISAIRETETSTGNVLMFSKNTYDSMNRVSGISYTIGTTTKTYTFNYEFDTSNVVSVDFPDGNSVYYTYDSFERLTSKRIKAPNQTEDQFISKEEYTYATASDDYPINLIASIKYNESTSDMQSYTYDDMGNLLTVSVGGTLKLSYEYDDALQLVRENNVYANATYVYEYDLYGNITAKKTYAYTAPGTAVSGTYTTITYTYGDANWGDLLTNYDGTTITYDASGNPNKWHNIAEMLWQGRQLYDLHFEDASELSFKYNADGIRTEKKKYNDFGILTETITYTLIGTRILREYHDLVSGTDYGIDFIYEGGDLPIGFIYGNASYYYRKNLQDDVISIVDASGTVVAEYTYDAWGYIVSIEDGNGNDVKNNPSHIANINPIRYRSYYYDPETGFYYLQSRYYDPTVGRFLNADTRFDTGAKLLMHNLYLYCANNPINYIDCSGEWLWEKIKNAFKKIFGIKSKADDVINFVDFASIPQKYLSARYLHTLNVLLALRNKNYKIQDIGIYKNFNDYKKACLVDMKTIKSYAECGFPFEDYADAINPKKKLTHNMIKAIEGEYSLWGNTYGGTYNMYFKSLTSKLLDSGFNIIKSYWTSIV